MKQIQRIPRPQGLTLLAQQTHQAPKTRSKTNKLRSFIIKKYIEGSLLYKYNVENTIYTNKTKDTSTYQLRPIELNELALGLGLSLTKVSQLIQDSLIKSSKGVLDDEVTAQMIGISRGTR